MARLTIVENYRDKFMIFSDNRTNSIPLLTKDEAEQFLDCFKNLKDVNAYEDAYEYRYYVEVIENDPFLDTQRSDCSDITYHGCFDSSRLRAEAYYRVEDTYDLIYTSFSYNSAG